MKLKHHDHRADEETCRRKEPQDTILQGFGHFIQVVRKAAQDGAGPLAVEIAQGQAVELFTEGRAQTQVQAFGKGEHHVRLKGIEKPGAKIQERQKGNLLSPLAPRHLEGCAYALTGFDSIPKEVDNAGTVPRSSNHESCIDKNRAQDEDQASMGISRRLPKTLQGLAGCLGPFDTVFIIELWFCVAALENLFFISHGGRLLSSVSLRYGCIPGTRPPGLHAAPGRPSCHRPGRESALPGRWY